MKKLILVIVTIIVAIMVYVNVNADVGEIVIPEAAIRVRVIANSNSINDQSMKMRVKEEIEKTISPMLVDVSDIDEARDIINGEVDNLENSIYKLFDEEGYDKGVRINFGDNYFPEKDYRGVHYDEGEYESLVVTIGEGVGDNWWCVLFPPLCLIEAEENTDVQYKSIVKEILDKYLS